MLKKLLNLSIILVLLAGCSLPNRAPAEISTEAQLNLNFQLPVDSIQTSNNARMLLTETSTVEIILYQPFEEDTITVDSTPTAAAVANLSNSEQVIAERVNFSSGSNVNYTINNIPLGTWNILIGSFLSETPQWQDTELEIPGPVSFAIYKNLTLEAGSNQLALTLAPNLDYGNSLDVMGNANGISVIGESSQGESMVFNLYNVAPLNYTIRYNLAAELDGLVELSFYDPAGNTLPVSFTDGRADLDMSVLGTNLTVTVRGTSGLGLQDFERLQVSMVPDPQEPTLFIDIGIYEIPPNLTVTLDGLLLPDAANITGYLYQTFTGDPISSGLAPTEDDLLAILEGSASAMFSATTSNSGGTVELLFNQANLTPGTWNLVVGATDEQSSWSDPNGMPTTQSFAWQEGLNLLNGENTSTLTMQPNPDNPELGEVWVTEPFGTIPWTGEKSYVFIKLVDLQQETPVVMNFDPGTILTDVWDDYVFYNNQGVDLNLTPVINETTYTWSYTPRVDGEKLFLVIFPNSTNYSSMDLSFEPNDSSELVISLTGYTDLLLQLDGVLLPDTESVLDVILYEVDTFSLLLSDFSSGMVSSNINNLLNEPGTIERILPYADITADNEILLENIPQGDYRMLISMVGSDNYVDSVITWEESAIDDQFHFTPSSYYENSTLTSLTGNSNNMAVRLVPNYTRYPELTSGSTMQWMNNNSPSWDYNSSKDYVMIFLDNFAEGSDYPLNFQSFYSLDFLFHDVAFYNAAGIREETNYTVSLTSTGEILHSWTYNDTLDNDVLMILFEINRANAERYLDVGMSPILNINIDPASNSISEYAMYTNQIPTSFIDLEKSIMTNSGYSLDVFMYDGAPLTGAPTQEDIDLLLNERSLTRGSISIMESTGLVSYHNNRVFSGNWNFLIATFMNPADTWEVEYDGGATVVPSYMSYTHLVNPAITDPSWTQSLAESFLLNEEKYRYLTSNWGSGISDGYYDFQNDTDFTYIDFDEEPLVFAFSNLYDTDNRIYLNADSLTSRYDIRIFDTEGTQYFASGDAFVTESVGSYTHYISIPTASPDQVFILTLTPRYALDGMPISIIVEGLPDNNGMGVSATQYTFPF